MLLEYMANSASDRDHPRTLDNPQLVHIAINVIVCTPEEEAVFNGLSASRAVHP
jgi:hypothetical protein